jgi:predicted ATPase
MIPFFCDKWDIFALHEGDDPGGFRHITSNATCFSSLELCPEADSPIGALNFRKSGIAFALKAIEQAVGDWKSDGRAEIYCTSRGLPFVISKLSSWHKNLDGHLNRVAYQLREQPTRFAVGEAAPPRRDHKKEEEIKGWYEPNAYHTYWTLDLLERLKGKQFDPGRNKSKDYAFLSERIPLFKLWGRQQLGLQVALHSADSSKLDSDQLAWSLAILTREPKDYQSDLALQDVIRRSFGYLFDTQEPVGTWRHYAPLFHYPNAGNAYCYVFETFVVLVEQALRPEAEFLRTVLREHAEGLLKLWRFAASTKAKLKTDPRVVAGESYGWSSGHRIRPEIESWATASVFAYSQMLRRLIGIWTCEDAIGGLNHKRSTRSGPKALEILNERTRTWTRPDLPDTLASMFINPRYGNEPKDSIDPDRMLISEDFARSVILFGPPGTGKTTLVSALADAIGWKYVELHPSHFVSEGLPNVQHTADVIFSQLMELDHTVILFDEIDELVREREMEVDQFGRFLTTSMLPRLAELWKARKVIYFVATNHIEFFDRAITRSERFDAVVFLSPPTFEAKKIQILKILSDCYSIDASFAPDLTLKSIDAKLPRNDCDSLHGLKGDDLKAKQAEPPPLTSALSKFAIVRWDELHGIALKLAALLGPDGRITTDLLQMSLERIGDGKTRGLGEYCRFISDPGSYERFDASRMGLWRVLQVEGLNLFEMDSLPKPLLRIGQEFFAKAPIGSHENIRLPGYTPILCKPTQGATEVLGAVMLKKKTT